jgi:hypothetical protein
VWLAGARADKVCLAGAKQEAVLAKEDEEEEMVAFSLTVYNRRKSGERDLTR